VDLGGSAANSFGRVRAIVVPIGGVARLRTRGVAQTIGATKASRRGAIARLRALCGTRVRLWCVRCETEPSDTRAQGRLDATNRSAAHLTRRGVAVRARGARSGTRVRRRADALAVDLAAHLAGRPRRVAVARALTKAQTRRGRLAFFRRVRLQAGDDARFAERGLARRVRSARPRTVAPGDTRTAGRAVVAAKFAGARQAVVVDAAASAACGRADACRWIERDTDSAVSSSRAVG
jgi:hypothetical protein